MMFIVIRPTRLATGAGQSLEVLDLWSFGGVTSCQINGKVWLLGIRYERFQCFFLRNFHIQRVLISVWLFFLLVSCRLILISFIVRGTLAILLLHRIQLLVFKIRLPSRSLWRETCFTLKLLDLWWVGLDFSSKTYHDLKGGTSIS